MSDEKRNFIDTNPNFPPFADLREELNFLHRRIRQLEDETERLRRAIVAVQDEIAPDSDPETGIPYGELT